MPFNAENTLQQEDAGNDIQDPHSRFSYFVYLFDDNRLGIFRPAPGRRTEIEAITGAVVELAARHDLDVPASRTILALVRFLEAREADPVRA